MYNMPETRAKMQKMISLLSPLHSPQKSEARENHKNGPVLIKSYRVLRMSSPPQPPSLHSLSGGVPPSLLLR